MARPASWIVLLMVTALTACGGGEPEEREVMKPEETVFRDLVTAPDKAQDRTDAAMEARRDALEQRLREDEGAPPEDR